MLTLRLVGLGQNHIKESSTCRLKIENYNYLGSEEAITNV